MHLTCSCGTSRGFLRCDRLLNPTSSSLPHLFPWWNAKFLNNEKMTQRCAEAFAHTFTTHCHQQVMLLSKRNRTNFGRGRHAWRSFVCCAWFFYRVFHLWVDCSPRFRGREMFTDIVIPGEKYEWRLLLCVSSRNSDGRSVQDRGASVGDLLDIRSDGQHTLLGPCTKYLLRPRS